MEKELKYSKKLLLLALKLLSQSYSFLLAFMLIIYSSISYTDGFPFTAPTLKANLFVSKPLDMAVFNKDSFNTQYSGHFSGSSEENTEAVNKLISDFQQNNYGVLSSTDLINRMIVFVIENLDYDLDYRLVGLNDAIADGAGVCWHYAYLFSVLCNSYNIQNDVLYGKLEPLDTPHVWNRIKLEGQFYYFDLTWFDSNTLSQCLWLTESEIKSVLHYNKFRIVWPLSRKSPIYQE